MTIIASRTVRSTDRLIDASTVGIQIPQQPAAPAVESVPLSPFEIGRQAYGLVLAGTARTLPEVVDALGVTVEQVRDGIRAFLQHETGIDPAAVAAFGPPCPPWCTRDHTPIHVDGWGSLGVLHERIVTELTAKDAATFAEQATASVIVESSEEGGEVVGPPRVVLTVANGPEGAYPSEANTQGWEGTAEQAEQLANALLLAARTIRAAR